MKYVFCDAGSGWWFATSLDSPTPTLERLFDLPVTRAVSVRLDEDGEILAAEYRNGRIVRLTEKTN
jgi:hypothetical protein